ncbi:MAG: hypothetical protein ABIL66_10815 [candidate division WOR-3 bacterium]
MINYQKKSFFLTNLLLLIFIYLSFNCTSSPGEKKSGIIEANYPEEYYLNSNSLFNVSVKALNNTSITYYVWFRLTLFTIESGESLCYSANYQTVPTGGDTILCVLTAGPFNSPPFREGIGQELNIFMTDTPYDWGNSPLYQSGLLYFSFVKTDTGPGGPGKQLVKWSGDFQRGRLNESLNDTVLYKIRVRIVDNLGNGCENCPVNFATNKGSFTMQDYQTRTVEGVTGIAEAVLKLSEYSSPEDSFDYVITVTSDSTPNTITFKARCAQDEECSSLPVPWTHKKWTYPSGDEIKGDIFADNTNEDPANWQKNVKIEIDYDPNVISLNDLGEVACSTANILERGRMHPDSANSISGIWVKIASISSQDTVICPSTMTESDCKAALARSRDSLDHIHCILGTKFDSPPPRPLGHNVIDTLFLPNASYYNQRVFRFGHKSSDDSMQLSLNKAGVFVFVNEIKDVAGSHWKLVTAFVLAHEIGHTLQMGHTNIDSFGTNVMYPRYTDTIWMYWDKLNFFNIKSLQDAFTLLGDDTLSYKYWRTALTTREQLGVNTVGFNYYDREGGKMFTNVIPLVTTLIAINPAGESFVDKIPSILSHHQPDYGKPYKVKIEDEGSLGILYITRDSDNDVFNYVRYDTLGNISLDLRKFATSPRIIESYDIEKMDLTVPCADYITDKNSNLWFFYTKGTNPENKHLCWLKVNKEGRVIEKKETSIVVRNAILAAPSKNNNFQLYMPNIGMWAPMFCYYNPNLKEPVKTTSHPFFDAFNISDLANDKLLVVSCSPYPPFSLKYIVINEIGKIEKAENILLDSCAFAKIENHGMIFNIDAFNYQDSLLVAVSIWTPYLMNKVNTFYLVKFDGNGNLLKPDRGIKEGKIMPIEAMPKNIKASIVSTFYYGVDGEGNLYLKKWNSEEQQNK